MVLRRLVCHVSVAALAIFGVAMRAQTPQSPDAYTVTENNVAAGPAMVTRTYRLGSKAVVDLRGNPAEARGSETVHLRTFYDLETKESLTWDLKDLTAPCIRSSFKDDWGDPFTGAADLVKQGAKPVGTESIRGFTTTVLQTPVGPSGSIKAWVDPTTGLVVKEAKVPLANPPQTTLEVTDLNLAPPPDSVFGVPAPCGTGTAVVQSAPQISEIASLTGGNEKDYVNATEGPASKNSCTVVFKIVRAGTMAAITNGFQVAVDLKVATEPTPSYSIGVGPDGRATFAGGALHEITSQSGGGVFRMENAPEQFEMDIEFGIPGAVSASIYRQCVAPQTVLLYVVKNPANVADGGAWLWVKSGKLATTR